MLYPLRRDEPRCGENAQMLARRRLAHAQFFGDEDAADAVLLEIAVNLRREMAARVLQPFKDLPPSPARKRTQGGSKQRVFRD